MAKKPEVGMPRKEFAKKKRTVDPEALTMEPIVIDGRKFIMDDSPTPEQDMEAMSIISDIGIDQTDLSKLLAVRVDHAMKDVVVKAYKSGKMWRLLGCVLVEEGEEWSPEVAEEAGDLFRAVRDQEVKLVLERNIVKLLTAFFVSGLFLPEISPNSSIGDLVKQGQSQGGSSTTATGIPSSGKLQAAIRVADKRSSNGGHSVKPS